MTTPISPPLDGLGPDSRPALDLEGRSNRLPLQQKPESQNQPTSYNLAAPSEQSSLYHHVISIPLSQRQVTEDHHPPVRFPRFDSARPLPPVSPSPPLTASAVARSFALSPPAARGQRVATSSPTRSSTRSRPNSAPSPSGSSISVRRLGPSYFPTRAVRASLPPPLTPYPPAPRRSPEAHFCGTDPERELRPRRAQGHDHDPRPRRPPDARLPPHRRGVSPQPFLRAAPRFVG